MNILCISNGHGEDLIACKIASANTTTSTSLHITGIPLVGTGHAYKQHRIPLIIQNPPFPSGGFIRSIKDLLSDLKNGLLTHVFHQIKLIRKQSQKNSITIAVGDIFCLIMASFSKNTVYFIPTAKSDTFMPHSFIERFLIKRLAKKSFPRDLQTTHSFLKHNLSAIYFGNPMMDNLRTTKKIITKNTHCPILGILPGSRQEAYKNCAFAMKVCEYLVTKQKDVTILCAFPDTLNLETLISMTKWRASKHTLQTTLTSPTNTCSIIFTNEFLPTINQANCLIGLAGTANEQALFLNKPVVCFKGFGPQSTLKRFQEQRKLMGPLLNICHNRNPNDICEMLIPLLNQKKPPIKQNQPHASAQILNDIIQTHLR